MPFFLNDTSFVVDGSKTSVVSASPVVVNGMILRLFNSSSTTQTYTYTDTSNTNVTINIPPSGSLGNPTYVLEASGSVLGTITPDQYLDSYFDFTKKVSAICLLITGSELGNSFTEQEINTAGSGSWTKPAGITQVIVECLSGGGAGGGATINNCGGGGGGGGQYVKKLLFYSSAEQVIPYVVGAGGVGSTGNGTSGSNTSWDSDVVRAVGGAGGLADQNQNLNPLGGGVAATTEQAIGDIVYNGSDGGGGYYDAVGAAGVPGSFGGYGGESAGTTGEGGGRLPFDLGNFGANGEFVSSGGINGGNATVEGPFGGGGGGAARVTSGPNRSGGSGGRGRIRLIYR